MTSGPPRYYPAFLDLRGKRCVVVGGGMVARRKVEGLCETGADVVVIAPEIGEMPTGVQCIRRGFVPGDLDDAMLVIAATDDPAINTLVARSSAERHILVNVVDAPEECSFIVPAVVRQGGLCLAISTGGASPTLARELKNRFAKELDPAYGELVDLLWRLRREWEPQAIAASVSEDERRRRWAAIAQLPLLERLRNGDLQGAEAMARLVLNSES